MNKASNHLSDPSVSVVIPLYNKGKYIDRALSSVLSQTHVPSEIIVVDDGSTDDGPERVKQFALSNPNITLIRQENRGPGAARNAGLAAAKGKYIAFLDADDEWLPSFLSTGLQMPENHANGIKVVWTAYFKSPGMEPNSRLAEVFAGYHELLPNMDFNLVAGIINFAWTGSGIMHTATVRRWGGFYEKDGCFNGEDTYLFLKLLFNERFAIIPSCHAIYHREASDICGCERNEPLPLAPYLTDVDNLIKRQCPTPKRELFKKYLQLRALAKVESLAKYGDKKGSRELFDAFFEKGKFPFPRVHYVRFLIFSSPLLPRLRKMWSWIKPFVNRSSARQRLISRSS